MTQKFRGEKRGASQKTAKEIGRSQKKGKGSSRREVLSRGSHSETVPEKRDQKTKPEAATVNRRKNMVDLRGRAKGKLEKRNGGAKTTCTKDRMTRD